MALHVNIEKTLAALLAQEDTDGDKKITIEDNGPKEFSLISEDGETYVVKGTYHLSNLLQELVIARSEGKEIAVISKETIEELPVERVSRMIREYYWNGLTRSMDESGIENLVLDTKNESLISTELRIYVPYSDAFAFDYYKSLEDKFPISVIRLPETITAEFVRSLNDSPGILSLKLEDHNGKTKGSPFVVPGGRFNEMYGWDSYFEAVGLLIDGRTDLAKGMADNFQYQIEHYGKILNANRSYYLTRTQPPFYSSMIREVYEVTGDKEWLTTHLKTAIKEYETVWMVEGKRLTATGLNRYLAEGIGTPPECEAGHFHAVFRKYAEAAGMDVSQYEAEYVSGTVNNPELDDYFVHDRSVRESGHDTSYRLEDRCADLVLVELNAMLYKYEMDFAELIASNFDDRFEYQGTEYSSALWKIKAAHRKSLVDTYLWNPDSGLYFDYDFRNKEQLDFVSATLFTPLWARMASKEQAAMVVKKGIPLLKEAGGIASCTEESRGPISEDRPQRQWDYPNGWAPHQMMIWRGLYNYGYEKEAQKLIYLWLYMITRNAVDYNGTIPEKYDVVAATHKVFAEYGNVGTQFEYITREGFGWMNASYQYGLSLLEPKFRESLNQLTPPAELFKDAD